MKSIFPLSENQIQGIEKWKAAQPIETLDVSDFKTVLRLFRLSTREYKLEYFVDYEAKVLKHDKTLSEDSVELLFPIRYIGTIHTLRKLLYSTKTNFHKNWCFFSSKQKGLPFNITF